MRQLGIMLGLFIGLGCLTPTASAIVAELRHEGGGSDNEERIRIDPRSEDGVTSWLWNGFDTGIPSETPNPAGINPADGNRRAELLHFDSPFTFSSHPITGTPAYAMPELIYNPFAPRSSQRDLDYTLAERLQDAEYRARVTWTYEGIQPFTEVADFRYADVRLNVRYLDAEGNVLSEHDQLARLEGYHSADALFASRNPIGEPPAGVPEPASLLLFGSGLVGIMARRKRRDHGSGMTAAAQSP